MSDTMKERESRASVTAPTVAGARGGQAGASSLQSAMLHRKIQRRLMRRAGEGEIAPGADQAVAQAASSAGAPLPSTLQRKFEGSTGADLSGVRVHTGEASEKAASSVSAKAYAVGNDIHFGKGQYDPGSSGGQHLIAHEVAHTVQQSGSPGRAQFKLDVSSPGDGAEHEADRMADAMTTGAPAPAATSVNGGGAIARWSDPGAKEEAKDMAKEKAKSATPTAAPDPVVAKLDLNADVETVDRTKITYKELQDAQVGHAWVKLRYLDPQKAPDALGSPTKSLVQSGIGAPMGFWPLIHRAGQWVDGSSANKKIKDRLAKGYTPGGGASADTKHEGFAMNPFKSWVPGRVEEPDDAHSPKGTKTFDLTEKQVESMMAWVDTKRTSNYSLYKFNCTDFAIGAVKAAGHSPPDGSQLGICLPNALYKDILEMKQHGDSTATTTPLGTDETEPTAKKK